MTTETHAASENDRKEIEIKNILVPIDGSEYSLHAAQYATRIARNESGASGNTGTIAVQLGKKMGAKVIAVSKDNWIKTDFGADYTSI
ncbi:MAG: universal stress protein [Candidatus Nitrosopolaris sp.]